MMAGLIVVLLIGFQNTAARPSYTLRVDTTDGITQLSLTADGARLSDIAADLAKRLRIPVIVGPSIRQDPVVVQFSDSALEPALTALAARVSVDYELRQNTPPAPQGIHLLGIADPEPELNAVVKGASLGLLISGHTEETTEPTGGDPLRVSGDRNRITVVSRQQPLSLVLMAISEVLGVPVEMKGDEAEIVDADMTDVAPEEALTRLSPTVRLYVRVNANRFERTLLRIVVPPPAKQDR